MIRYDRKLRILAMCLAMLAGFVDAVGFLKSGGLFVSFMSGNSTRLAVGIATGSHPAALAATLIIAFVGGVFFGSLIAVASNSQRKRAVLATVAILLTCAGLFATRDCDVWAVHFMAIAMGCANTVFQRDGEVSLGVTYMTGTLVKIGQRAAAAVLGGDKLGWLPYLQLWLGLVGGAITGAIGFHYIGMNCLWLAALCTAILACLAPKAALR